MKTFLMLVFLFVCAALTVIVIAQDGRDQRLGSIAGMGDTFWGRNRGRSLEGRVVKITAVLAAAFLAIALLLNAMPGKRGNAPAASETAETETELILTETAVMTETEAADGNETVKETAETEADASGH